jgi:hypothetical protein
MPQLSTRASSGGNRKRSERSLGALEELMTIDDDPRLEWTVRKQFAGQDKKRAELAKDAPIERMNRPAHGARQISGDQGLKR